MKMTEIKKMNKKKDSGQPAITGKKQKKYWLGRARTVILIPEFQRKPSLKAPTNNFTGLVIFTTRIYVLLSKLEKNCQSVCQVASKKRKPMGT